MPKERFYGNVVLLQLSCLSDLKADDQLETDNFCLLRLIGRILLLLLLLEFVFFLLDVNVVVVVVKVFFFERILLRSFFSLLWRWQSG